MLHIEEEGREMIVPEKRPEPRSGLFSPSRPFSFSWVLAVQLFQMPLRGWPFALHKLLWAQQDPYPSLRAENCPCLRCPRRARSPRLEDSAPSMVRVLEPSKAWVNFTFGNLLADRAALRVCWHGRSHGNSHQDEGGAPGLGHGELRDLPWPPALRSALRLLTGLCGFFWEGHCWFPSFGSHELPVWRRKETEARNSRI